MCPYLQTYAYHGFQTNKDYTYSPFFELFYFPSERVSLSYTSLLTFTSVCVSMYNRTDPRTGPQAHGNCWTFPKLHLLTHILTYHQISIYTYPPTFDYNDLDVQLSRSVEFQRIYLGIIKQTRTLLSHITGTCIGLKGLRDIRMCSVF